MSEDGGVERQYLDSTTLQMLRKLISEYDVHEAKEIAREQATCKACLYFETCQYSYYNTTGNKENWKEKRRWD